MRDHAPDAGDDRREETSVHVELTREAEELVRRKGGAVVVDYIRPIGCGKIAEVSVGTYVRGRNLAPYLRIAIEPGVLVLLAPQLVELATTLRIARAGTLVHRLTAQLDGER